MKKITLTVGIPAYNEEHNIESFLREIFKQKLMNVKLEKVLIYSDCSSDDTNKIVKKLTKEFPAITLVEGKSRKGKYYRVNQLFHLNKSDVEIILDADLALVGDSFLETLTTQTMANKKALMVSAHVELIRPKKFVQKIYHTGFVMYDFMRLNIPGYDSATNFHGAATAYKLAFTKEIDIPSDLTDPHLYIYLFAKLKNGFRYTFDAVILQVPPSTLTDIKKVMNRSIGKRDVKLESLFGAQMIHDVHQVPSDAKMKGLLQAIRKYPFYVPLGIAFNYYLNFFVAKKAASKSPIWEVTKSTKKSLNHDK